MVEGLPSLCEALSSIPELSKTKKICKDGSYVLHSEINSLHAGDVGRLLGQDADSSCSRNSH